jgi:hypothetical protein
MTPPENKMIRPDRTKAGLIVGVDAAGRVRSVRDAASGQAFPARSVSIAFSTVGATISMEILARPDFPIAFEATDDG